MVADGGTVLLLHGGGPGVDAATNWETVRGRLSESFACLAPDLLGFGDQAAVGLRDDRPRGPRAWALARARQVLGLLDALGLDRVHVVGNSAAGGAVALAILATAPERVGRAVVMGGAGTGPLPPRVPFYGDPSLEAMRGVLAGLVADTSEHRELIGRLAPVRLRLALQPGAEAAFRAMFDDDAEGTQPWDLAAITRPVLALHGERDRVSSVAVSRRLSAALPDGRLSVVAGAGHWIHVDKPDEFCRQVVEFFSA
jgi:2-hydroxymuconate-semialdehyde hydrolase